MDAYTGDLSAIIIQNLPIWVELRRTPAREIALHDNWEEKIERMALATMEEDVTMLAGVPSWSLVLLKRILELKGVQSIHEVWPNFELFVHGGVSFKPYKSQFEALSKGPQLNYLETYNASEGFFGIQDSLLSDELLLMLDYGMYYEFIPLTEVGKEFPISLSLSDVQIGEVYALVISSNAGLWRYMLGDTVRITSVHPFRIQVAGRTKLFINAFGEELMIDNAEEAIKFACEQCCASVAEYTAAPIFMNLNGKGAHEWLIEFDKAPTDFDAFMRLVDLRLCEVNSDYAAKRAFDLNMSAPLGTIVAPGTFFHWMKMNGKLGGQHKVPRLSNDRKIIDEVKQFCELV
ncbi:MAG: hypothetical protein RL226_2019, partial [Bacteroidota bacterium]